jgi:hypothetical protein
MKKSMMTLFALSALMMSSIAYCSAMPNQPQMQPTTNTQTLQQVYGTNLSDANTVMHDKMQEHQNQNNDDLEVSLHKLDADAQNAFMLLRSDFQAAENNLRSHHMNRMQKDQGMIDMMYKGGLRAVEDAKGNIIGAYKTLGETKGYRYGSLYNTNLNQAPVSVIESGLGTPANVAVSGASSNILGYLDNPNFNGSMGSPKQITLLQYTMPAQPVMDHAAPPADMPAQPANDVHVQSYHNENDENDDSESNHKHHHNHHHDNDNDRENEHHHLISIF